MCVPTPHIDIQYTIKQCAMRYIPKRWKRYLKAPLKYIIKVQCPKSANTPGHHPHPLVRLCGIKGHMCSFMIMNADFVGVDNTNMLANLEL